jgi:hypothetical protein
MSASRLRRSFAFVVIACVATVVLAQAHPNVERGFSPGKMYHFDGVDGINVFNGVLNVTVPIGQTYRVGGDLSYSLSLSYAPSWESEDWSELIYEGGDQLTERDYSWFAPLPRSNAGFGWILSMGRLLERRLAGCEAPGIPLSETFIGYESPDGAVHCFYPTLRSAETQTSAGIYYTRDATYLRANFSSSTRTLEFPNGEVREFDSDGRLTKLRDRFDNYVTVTYEGTAAGAVWHIHDSAGRDHYVNFAASASYPETAFTNVAHVAIKSVDLAAFGGKRVVYTLNYENEETGGFSVIDRKMGLVAFRAPQQPDPCGPPDLYFGR